jgi:PAS domain S-box-containing protein
MLMADEKDGGITKDEFIAKLRHRIASLERTVDGVKQAEIVARVACEYAENIVQTVRHPLLVLDSDLKVRSANQSFYDTFKVTLKETIGNLIYDLGNSQWDIPKLRELLHDILPKDKEFDNFEIDHVFSDIGHKIMLLNARRVVQEGAASELILLAIEDITERRQLERLIEESEERYRRLFETANDGIVLLEKHEGHIVHANPATEKMLGYSEAEYNGKMLQDIGVPLDMSDFPSILQSLNKNGILNYDHVQVKTKSGQYIDTDIYMVDRASLAQCNIRDVTEQKRAEEELRQLNRTLRALSKSSLAMIRAKDETSYLNEVCRIIVEDCGQALVWIGYAEENEGKTVRPVAYAGFDEGYIKLLNVTWADTERGRGPVGTAIRTGQPSVFRNMLTDPRFTPWRADALKRGYAASVGLPLLADGRAFGSLTIYSREPDPFSEEEVKLLANLADDLANGISSIRLRIAHVKAEDELRLFKNLINQANDAILVIDPVTGRFLDVNAKACNNLGYDREELLEMEVLDIDDIVMPDTLSWKTHVDKIKNEGQLFLEGRHRRKDGTTYPVEVNVKYISLEKSDYMVAVVRDISERKKAEEALQKSEKKYKDLFDSTLDGIYQMDADGVFILMNPAGAKMFGYESPDEIVGRKGLDFWRDPRDRDVFREELRVKKSVSGYRMKLKKKKGEPIEIETSSTIKEDEKGSFLGMEGILRDVTEHQKLEDQLLQAQKMEAVGQLAGGISHDFNNILTAIIGYAHMLKMKIKDDEKLRTFADHILSLSDRAANLTQSLLAFSRKQIMHSRPVNLNQTIRNVEKMLVRIIGEDIQLQTMLSEQEPIVMADPGQIEQVLMNLATNARDAMPEGGHLSIASEIVMIDNASIETYFIKEGAYALIAITDAGAGMDRETREKIFDPFFTTKEVGKGTGLGLSMVYGIIKQHNGYITVYSEPGEGTTFRIYLPLIEANAETEKVAHEVIPALETGTETLLLAEDEAEVRVFNKKLLEEYGYKVIEAVDGDDAIQKFKLHKNKIQLVILDVIMPNRSGREAYEAIKKITPDIRVLFTSGYPAEHINGMIAKGAELISKPASPTKLLRKIREVLDQ